VLVVEDDEHVRRLLGTVLQRHGYEVVQAHNGREALAAVAEYGERLHAMVADLGLPEVDGLALCRELAKIHPDLRVLFITGHQGDHKLLKEALATPARILYKPFTPALLCEALEEVLAFPEHSAESVCAEATAQAAE
jgi:two-component system cell cycle sensor histidine kinase/response regulator CckA